MCCSLESQSVLHNQWLHSFLISFSLPCPACCASLTQVITPAIHPHTQFIFTHYLPFLVLFFYQRVGQVRLMSTTSAQGQSDSESATNLRTNQAISSTLPTRHSYHPPPTSHPQSPPQHSQNLSDMTSLSSVPRYAWPKSFSEFNFNHHSLVSFRMDQPEDLAPLFHARPYSHLPTPQRSV